MATRRQIHISMYVVPNLPEGLDFIIGEDFTQAYGIYILSDICVLDGRKSWENPDGLSTTLLLQLIGSGIEKVCQLQGLHTYQNIHIRGIIASHYALLVQNQQGKNVTTREEEE